MKYRIRAGLSYPFAGAETVTYEEVEECESPEHAQRLAEEALQELIAGHLDTWAEAEEACDE